MSLASLHPLPCYAVNFFLFVLGGGVEKLGIVAKKFIKHVSSSLIDHKIDPTAFSRRQKRGF